MLVRREVANAKGLAPLLARYVVFYLLLPQLNYSDLI